MYKDVDGQVISKDEFMGKLRTGQFAVYDYQAQGRAFTSISLRKADTPDAVRTQALSPARAFGTAAPAFSSTPGAAALTLPKHCNYFVWG